MPVYYYIIPMSSPPYSRDNNKRPLYVDEIQCNWTGHNVDELGVYICKVNTTAAKHADLNSRSLVFQLRWDWNLSIGSLTTLQHNALNNWLINKGLVAASDSETVGDVLMRIINSGLWSLGNTALTAQYQNLTQTQKDKITALCTKWGITQPTSTETMSAVSGRCGRVWWNAPDLTVEEY